MGVYYNVVRKSKPVLTEIDGRIVPVYRVTFFCKAQDLDDRIMSDWWNKRAHQLRMVCARMDNAWLKAGIEPEYVVDTCDDGPVFETDCVYRVKPGFRGYYDTESLDHPNRNGERRAEFVGVLSKSGKKVILHRMTREEWNAEQQRRWKARKNETVPVSVP